MLIRERVFTEANEGNEEDERSRAGSILVTNAAPRYARTMSNRYTAIVKNEGEWWVGWIEEVPGANAQEKTRAELLLSLKEALGDLLELNRADARQAIEGPFEEVIVTA